MLDSYIVLCYTSCKELNMQTKWWECKTCNMIGMTKQEAKIHHDLSGHSVNPEPKVNPKDRDLSGWARIILDKK